MRNNPLKTIIYTCLAFLFAGLLLAALERSWVKVTLPASSGAVDLSYTLSDKDGVTKKGYSKKTSFRVFIKKGDYTLSLSSPDGSAVSSFKASGFLTTKSLDLNSISESSREFVGDNPAPCMSYRGGTLYSNECTATMRDMNEHVAAQAKTPGYTRQMKSLSYDEIESNVALKSGDLYMTKPSSTSTQRILQFLVDSPSAIPKSRTVNVPTAGEYTLASDLDSFIIYSKDGSIITKFTSFESAPENLPSLVSKDKGFSFKSLSFTGNKVVVIYSSGDGGDDTLLRRSRVYSLEGTSLKLFKDLRDNYTFAHWCGDKLCLATSNLLEIYDYTSGKKENSINISGEVLSTPDGSLYAQTIEGITEIKPNQTYWRNAYSFGQLKPCGIKPTRSGLLVCVVDGKSVKHALYINTANNSNDKIDKNYYSLNTLLEASNISIYKNFINVTPFSGEVVYDQNNGGFSINQSLADKNFSTVKQKAQQLGIGPEYKINSLYE
jgi:hypothetical protein